MNVSRNLDDRTTSVWWVSDIQAFPQYLFDCKGVNLF